MQATLHAVSVVGPDGAGRLQQNELQLRFPSLNSPRIFRKKSRPMKTVANRLFAPEPGTRWTDAALLLLRLWLGLTMLFTHGLAKLTNFGEMSSKFLDLFGIGSTTSLALAVFAEVFCSAMLAVGLLTKFAAFTLSITMLVAFAMVHEMKLGGERSGELAFIYLAGYVTLLAAGPGRYSADGFLFSKATKLSGAP